MEIELFLVERQTEYRMFGFVAAVLERLPFVGILFQISNPIGAAMCEFSDLFFTYIRAMNFKKWLVRNHALFCSSGAHDLEKEQHAFASGEKLRTKIYAHKDVAVVGSDLPEGAVGSWPSKKGPVRIEKDGSEVGL